MKVSPHFLRLYHKTVRRYRKLTTRLRKQVSSGTFQQQTTYQQHELLLRIHKVWRRLLEMRTQLKLAVAASAVGLLLTANTVNAQEIQIGPFEELPRNLSPLPVPLTVSYRPVPEAVDLDNDGDMDLAIAEPLTDIGFKYFKNEGTASTPKYVDKGGGHKLGYVQGLGSQFPPIAMPSPAPSFSDLDKDNDVDMAVGISTGEIKFYKHTPAAWLEPQTGAWNATSKTGNPFDGLDFGSYANPCFVDFDKDGNDDIIIGSTSGAPFNKNFFYYKNNGDGSFTEASITHDINSVLEVFAPLVIDLDKDGRYDILAGELNGTLKYYKQQPDGSLQEQTGSNNPFSTISKGANSYTSPTAADLDNDGDLDIILGFQGSSGARLEYFENKGNSTFEEKTKLESPFGGVKLSSSATPMFIDYNNDNLLDALIASDTDSDGEAMKLFRKNEDGSFSEVPAANNPFAALNTITAFHPSMIDLNGDGQLDIVGAGSNQIQYFKKVGETYVEENFETGPFKDITGINEGKSDFVDIDNDGDFDLFVGGYVNTNESYRVRLFKNVGTPQNPAFTEQTELQNPLHEVSEEYFLYPKFTDIDHDGDYDVLIGEGGGVIEYDTGNEFIYFENTGTKEEPVFEYRGNMITPGRNGSEPSPAFVDHDGDGDLDIFQGESSGHIVYFENQNPVAITTIGSTPVTVEDTLQVILDPDFTITDDDNDYLTEVRITILNYENGDAEIRFTPQGGVTGSFDAINGVFTILGKASIAEYQNMLRSVTIGFPAGGGGQKQNARKNDYTRTVSIQVYDADHTTPQAVSKEVAFVESAQAETKIIVYNAVAPHSTLHDNQWMHIENLPAQNTVSIFNRWGDKVYEVRNYDDTTPAKRFEGISDHGKELPSGTYFYKIETNTETITGYLSLKQ